MNPRSSRSRARLAGTWARAWIGAVAAVGLVSAAGCSSGSTSSSPPAYCSQRNSLENSVKGLTSLNASSGISGLESSLKKVQSDANALAGSAKSDFPSQTSAVKTSVSSLQAAVKALAANPSAANIETVAKDATSVVNAAKSFETATNSKCS